MAHILDLDNKKMTRFRYMAMDHNHKKYVYCYSHRAAIDKAMVLQRFDVSASSSSSSSSSSVDAPCEGPPSKKPKVQAGLIRNLSWNQLQSLEVDDPGNFSEHS